MSKTIHNRCKGLKTFFNNDTFRGVFSFNDYKQYQIQIGEFTEETADTTIAYHLSKERDKGIILNKESFTESVTYNKDKCVFKIATKLKDELANDKKMRDIIKDIFIEKEVSPLIFNAKNIIQYATKKEEGNEIDERLKEYIPRYLASPVKIGGFLTRLHLCDKLYALGTKTKTNELGTFKGFVLPDYKVTDKKLYLFNVDALVKEDTSPSYIARRKSKFPIKPTLGKGDLRSQNKKEMPEYEEAIAAEVINHGDDPKKVDPNNKEDISKVPTDVTFNLPEFNEDARKKAIKEQQQQPLPPTELAKKVIPTKEGLKVGNKSMEFKKEPDFLDNVEITEEEIVCNGKRLGKVVENPNELYSDESVVEDIMYLFYIDENNFNQLVPFIIDDVQHQKINNFVPFFLFSTSQSDILPPLSGYIANEEGQYFLLTNKDYTDKFTCIGRIHSVLEKGPYKLKNKDTKNA